MTLEPWAHTSPVTGTVLRGWRTPPTGRPLLHFLHGNGFCGRVYEPMLQLLARDFDLWLCDAPGHGDSEATPRFAGWNRCAEAALEAFQAGRAAYGDVPLMAVGHSFGGVQTALLLGAAGQPFSRAVLLDPVLFPPPMLLAAQLIGRTGAGLVNPLARATKRRRREWPSREHARERLRGRGTYRGWGRGGAGRLRHPRAAGRTRWPDRPGPAEVRAGAGVHHLQHHARSAMEPAAQHHRAHAAAARRRAPCPSCAAGCARAHAHNAPHVHVQITTGGHCFMQEHPADAAARVRAHLLG